MFLMPGVPEEKLGNRNIFSYTFLQSYSLVWSAYISYQNNRAIETLEKNMLRLL